VLIEHPDGADLWAHADALREAGYDVAVCRGPSGAAERVPRFRRPRGYWEDSQPVERTERTLCPLISEGHCPLAEGADVVVSSTRVTDGREIVAALSGRSAPALVVEGTTLELKRYGDAIGGATEIEVPVSPKQLVQAVERAKSTT
jgi:hypothetical protein